MILFCPMCGLEVHRTRQDDLRDGFTIANESEDAVELHLSTFHLRRYRLYERTGWRWVLKGFAL